MARLVKTLQWTWWDLCISSGDRQETQLVRTDSTRDTSDKCNVAWWRASMVIGSWRLQQWEQAFGKCEIWYHVSFSNVMMHESIHHWHQDHVKFCERGFDSCTTSTRRIQRLHRSYLAYSSMGFQCWLYWQACCHYWKWCQCCANHPCISRSSQTSVQLSTYSHLVQKKKPVCIFKLYQVYLPLCSTCGTLVSIPDFPSCKCWSMNKKKR